MIPPLSPHDHAHDPAERVVEGEEQELDHGHGALPREVHQVRLWQLDPRGHAAQGPRHSH